MNRINQMSPEGHCCCNIFVVLCFMNTHKNKVTFSLEKASTYNCILFYCLFWLQNFHNNTEKSCFLGCCVKSNLPFKTLSI